MSRGSRTSRAQYVLVLGPDGRHWRPRVNRYHGGWQWEPVPDTEIEAKRRGAHMRSLALFRSHLSKSQARQYKARKKITVIGSNGGRYQLECDRVVNNITCAKKKMQYCIVISSDSPFDRAAGFYGLLPRGDHLLAQKFLIETNERRFLKIAHASRPK